MQILNNVESYHEDTNGVLMLFDLISVMRKFILQIARLRDKLLNLGNETFTFRY